MKVALLAEGCYPFETGGVSTWCDQLIRGLSDMEFDVITLTGGTSNRPRYEMPPNVRRLRVVPLWGLDSTAGPRTRPTARDEFITLYRRFLHAALLPDVPQEEFTHALRDLQRFAQRSDLTTAMHRDETVAALADTWLLARGEASISMHEAVEATDLIEHFLRPLSFPVPRVDLCHAVSNGLPVLMALAAKWTYGTPIVMSEHGVYLRERYLSFRTVRYRWPVKAVLLAVFRGICATGYASADQIVPVNFYNQRWETRHGANPDTIATAFNGVHAEDYPALVDEPETPTIGWVGRIDPLKDLETLVRAFQIVLEDVPGARLRLFGPTSELNLRYEQRVRDLVDELGLTDAVAFEGPVRPVTAAYQSSTVVALSSISEGLPYTVMEAMMCGRATVSTDVGGVPELAGEAGLIVPPRDPDAFAEACVHLLLDDDRRHRLAAAARERALELFQIEQMLQAYRGIYTAAAAHAGTGAAPSPRAEGTPVSTSRSALQRVVRLSQVMHR